MQQLTKNQVEQYLNRIKHVQVNKADLATLQSLHLAHVFNVPFENLDIHLGLGIDLDIIKVFKKIIDEKRGGYCFELNKLFALLLSQLGYQVRLSSARVLYGYPLGGEPRPRTHMVLFVVIEEVEYLVDVAFGNGLFQAIEAKDGANLECYGQQYRLRQVPDLGLLLELKVKRERLSLFSVEPELVSFNSDHEVANFFCSHSPDSVFTMRQYCTRPTVNGRITLDGMTLIVREKNKVEKTKIADISQYLTLLQQYFDINLPIDTEFSKLF